MPTSIQYANPKLANGHARKMPQGLGDLPWVLFLAGNPGTDTRFRVVCRLAAVHGGRYYIHSLSAADLD